MKLQRVNKSNPCTACGHDSWCLLGETAALCMRIQSDRPYPMKDGSIGYWHSFDAGKPRKWVSRPERKEPPKVDIAAIHYAMPTTPLVKIEALAESLGVSRLSLMQLHVRWSDDYRSWAFPMRDAFGTIIGIRLRAEDGRKWAVFGSRQGLFIPRRALQSTAWICEGPTDCAALVTLGLFAIGRPSCSGGSFILKELLKRLGTKKMVVVADNDHDKYGNGGQRFNPGMDGAQSLVRQIPIESCIVTLPTKDVREFIKQGGSKEDILALEEMAIVENSSQTTA